MNDGTNLTHFNPKLAKRLLDKFGFHVKANADTGEVMEYNLAEPVRGMRLKILPRGKLTWTGSLHVFVNDGKDNADDFPKTRLIQAIQEMAEVFEVDPEKVEGHALEAGVNFKLDGMTAESFVRSIALHRHEMPVPYSAKSPFYGVQFDRDQYRVKCYDKGTQHGLFDDLVRFEVRGQTCWLKNTGRVPVSTLAKLPERKTQLALGRLLDEHFAELLVVPPIYDHLRKPELKALRRLRDPNEWQALRVNKCRSAIGSQKRMILKILQRHGADIHTPAAAALYGKWRELLDG